MKAPVPNNRTKCYFFLIGIHSMQGRAITTRYRVASKKEKK